MRLVIGPTSAGKSTFIETLRREAKQRGEDLDVHFAFEMRERESVPTGPQDVVHYNLLRGLRSTPKKMSVQSAPLLSELVDAADEVVVLAAPRPVLLARAQRRELAEPDHEQHGTRRYDAEAWQKALESSHLAQALEHVALRLDELGKKATYLCTADQHVDGPVPVSRWQVARLVEADGERMCAAGHPEPSLDLGSRTYQADYREGAAGSMRSATLARALRMPLADKRLLDIGCAEGAAALSAVRMGAEVTGLEPKRNRYRKARQIAERLDLPLTLHNVLLDDFAARKGSFDVVLALNVIHHVPEPIAFLDRVTQLTSSHLVLEYPGLGDPKFARTLGGAAAPGDDLPLLGVSLPAEDQTFVYTPAAFERYLVDTLGAFTRHEVIESPIRDRWISVFSGRQRKADVSSTMAQRLQLKRQLERRDREVERLRQRVRDMEASRSWKVTRPLRSLASRGRG
jgi:2-polyprenyl-3-methyl-5-hydroxy-6-metoxy-1,4-benzoquinol methylase